MILCLFARFDPIASLLLPQYCMPPANESKSFDARPERILLDQAYKSYKSQTTKKKRFPFFALPNFIPIRVGSLPSLSCIKHMLSLLILGCFDHMFYT